jgi:hypothetical protein
MVLLQVKIPGDLLLRTRRDSDFAYHQWPLPRTLPLQCPQLLMLGIAVGVKPARRGALLRFRELLREI